MTGRRRLVTGLVAVAVLASAIIPVGIWLSGRSERAAPPAGGLPGTTTFPPPAQGRGPAGVPSAGACVARPQTVRVTGQQGSAYQVDAPTSDFTYDPRGVVSTAFPYNTLYPFVFGKVRHGRAPIRRPCTCASWAAP
jgi:hypothetical protein